MKEEKELKQKTGGAETMKTYKRVYGETRDHSQAIKAAYGWNKWAMENARAVGNIK